MKPIVVDASAVAPWFLPDEQSAVADQLYSDLRAGDATFWVPALWIWETANILRVAVRRGRLDAEAADKGIALLAGCNLQFDLLPDAHRRAQTLRLALVHGLSYYDAAYLELALRLNSQLASADRQLVAAAKNCGIPCFDL